MFSGEKNSNYKHGLKKHPLHKVWASMRQRCRNPKDKSYKNYGGRGICICHAWNEFKPFYMWAVSHGYKRGLTIERIDNNCNYRPSNCTFIPLADQSKNRRGLCFISFNGETKTLSQWARDIGIDRMTLKDRFKFRWSLKDALTTPSLGSGNRRR